MPRLTPPLLDIHDLRVCVDGKEVVAGVDLVVAPGEVHAIMGPNGSGKSSFANALMGHPRYRVTTGTVRFRGQDLLAMSSDQRAQAGLFLAFQYPKEIAGVSVRDFLFAALRARQGTGKRISPVQFRTLLTQTMDTLKIAPALMDRSLNKGFSGGEKKKAEILQLLVLWPTLALLDETDSGLDVDALKLVAAGVNTLRGPAFSAIVVTHYARILAHLKPDRVHVMVHGRIVESGGPSLARTLEREGYRAYTTAFRATGVPSKEV